MRGRLRRADLRVRPLRQPPPARTGYLHLRAEVRSRAGVPLCVADVADLEGPPTAVARARCAPLGPTPAGRIPRVVAPLEVVAAVRRVAPDIHWEVLGGDVLVRPATPAGAARWLLGAAVWVLLFLGAATTLLDFHADVNMPAAHRELYYIATGRRVQHPLAIEIPYAVGIGLGVLLFFSLPRGSGGDPGPLELELEGHRARLRGYWRQRGWRRR